ncbi:MAG: hypothetical protein U1E77_14105 [Inhella sp.]
MPQFLHHDLQLLNPRFDSPLLDVLTDLEHLREAGNRGSTRRRRCSCSSSRYSICWRAWPLPRIEGNPATLADCGNPRDARKHLSDALREIDNIELAMRQVEDAIEPGSTLSEHLLRGLHATTVQGLEREGDPHARQLPQRAGAHCPGAAPAP